MLLLFLALIHSCIVYVGQKPTRAPVVLLFKYATINKTYLIYLTQGYFMSITKTFID